MGGSMSLSSLPGTALHAVESDAWRAKSIAARRAMAAVAWHSLFWLAAANCVGVLLAAMLLVPGINTLLGGWTYGLWMPVHMDLQLYGWCSLPLVGFLFAVYGV